MPGISFFPGDIHRPSVFAFIVVVAVILALGVRLRGHAAYRKSGWSDTTHWIVNVFGPAFGVALFGLALIALVVQTIQGK